MFFAFPCGEAFLHLFTKICVSALREALRVAYVAAS